MTAAPRRLVWLLVLAVTVLTAACRDTPDASTPAPAPADTRLATPGVVVTRAVARLAADTASSWHTRVGVVATGLVERVPRAPRAAPIVVASGPVALSDIGLAFDTDRPLRVVEHTGGQWTFEEMTDAGPARIRVGTERGALALDGVEAAELLEDDFERFVARWRAQPGEVLEARRVPATAHAPAWAWISRREPDAARVDLALFVVDEADGAPGNARVILVQVDGDGVAESRLGQSLTRSARIGPVTETWLDEATLSRTDMPVRLRLPEGWRRAPDEVLAGRLAAVGPLLGSELNAPRLTIRTTGRPVTSLDAGLEALSRHVESNGGLLTRMEPGRFRGRPAIRYGGYEPGAEPLQRCGLLTLDEQGALLAVDVALTGREPFDELNRLLSWLELREQGDAIDHPAHEQGD